MTRLRAPLAIAMLPFAMLPGIASAQCTDADLDGYYYEADCGSLLDCNDADPTTYPSAPEACDGYDNDCSGAIDDDPSCNGACDLPEKLGDDIPLTEPSTNSWFPSLVSTPTGYAVAWDSRPQVFFRRLDPSGQPIGAPVEITRGLWGEYPSLAWTGSEYGVAWRELPYAVLLTRLNSSGFNLGTTAASSSSRCQEFARTVWAGSQYGIAWYDCRNSDVPEVYFARMTQEGSKIGSDVPVSVLDSIESRTPRLAWTGTHFGIVWQDLRRGVADGYFAKLDSVGSKMGDDVPVTDGLRDSAPHSIAWTGFNYGIVWSESDGEIYFRSFDSSGSPLGSSVRLTYDPAVSHAPYLAWNGEEYGLAWVDERDGNPEIYFARLDANGAILGQEHRVTSAGGISEYPSLVWDGSGYAVAWDDTREGSFQVYFAKIGCRCSDIDADSFSSCNGDCDDSDPNVHLGAPEICDNKDNDCDHSIDEDSAGLDSDADAIPNACDNCRFAFNPDQYDTDADGVGSSCDNCALVANLDQADPDADSRGTACDNCALSYNPFQDDFDADKVGDACDNCAFDWNAGQSDFDTDNQGDLCDLNDGLIYVFNTGDDNYIEWQAEAGFTAFNVYEGDLAVLRSTGVYTQAPGSNPLAEQHCGVTDTFVEDFGFPPAGKTAFHLVTGVTGGVEGSLGQDSAGSERPNHNPCP